VSLSTHQALTAKKSQDICLASSKIVDQKLRYPKTISSTKGQHLQGSAAVNLLPHFTPLSGLKKPRVNYFHSYFHGILETSRKKGTKVDGRTAQKAGHRCSLSGSIYAA